MASDDDEPELRKVGMASVIRVRLKHQLAWLGDLVVPPLCLACQEPMVSHDALCAQCWTRVSFIRAPVCDQLGIPLPFGEATLGEPLVSAAAVRDPPEYDRARAVAHHTGVMRDLIHGFKFRDRDETVRLFTRWLMGAGSELLPMAEVVIPVPLSRGRLFSRRFNQAALLAMAVAEAHRIPCQTATLLRVRRTASQVGLSRSERRINVAGAFRVPPERAGAIHSRSVLLIDDVITTGATVGACARALKAAGAARVDVLALALAGSGSEM